MSHPSRSSLILLAIAAIMAGSPGRAAEDSAAEESAPDPGKVEFATVGTGPAELTRAEMAKLASLEAAVEVPPAAGAPASETTAPKPAETVTIEIGPAGLSAAEQAKLAASNPLAPPAAPAPASSPEGAARSTDAQAQD